MLLRPVDKFLNSITMYRLLMWGLAALAIYAFLMSLIGQVAYGAAPLVFSWFLLMLSCYGFNYLFGRLFKAPTNVESSWITGLILFFTLAPAQSVTGTLLLVTAAFVAMASKYILAIKKRHIFNPAALALFVLAASGSGLAVWWIGTPAMLPGVLVLGLLVVRKIRRFDAFFAFAATAIFFSLLFAWRDHIDLLSTFQILILSWPLLFMGTIMLTEPLTMPPSRPLRIIYGAVIGVLFSTQFHIGPVYSTPELALLLGNLYSYIVGSRQRLVLTLREMSALSPGIYEFAFAPSEKLKFEVGQYLEWTLPHEKPDTRGNRRYFTVSSTPLSKDVRFATRIADHSSSFKKALLSLRPGETLTASSLAGDFTLPKDASRPLVFVAGGIGITPFASMLRHLIETGEKRPISLIYAANTENDFAYRDLIEEAKEKIGIQVTCLAGERITQDAFHAHVSDFAHPYFYISGPDIMVRIYREMLRKLGAHRTHIKSDYFPGL